MPRIRLAGFIIVPERDREAVQAALPEHIRLTREEPGCISFRVTPDEADPMRYEVAEEFATREAFELHQARAASSEWGAVTGDIDRHYEITELPS